jgi:hypothetical protein
LKCRGNLTKNPNQKPKAKMHQSRKTNQVEKQMHQSNKSPDNNLSDSIWEYHESAACDRSSQLLAAGKYELAIELLKLERLDSIANSLEEIEIALREKLLIES